MMSSLVSYLNQLFFGSEQSDTLTCALWPKQSASPEFEPKITTATVLLQVQSDTRCLHHEWGSTFDKNIETISAVVAKRNDDIKRLLSSVANEEAILQDVIHEVRSSQDSLTLLELYVKLESAGLRLCFIYTLLARKNITALWWQSNGLVSPNCGHYVKVSWRPSQELPFAATSTAAKLFEGPGIYDWSH